MKLAFVKLPAKAILPVCAALAMLSPGAQAESTYGYSAAGAAGATATAKVDLQITVPMLILLRVGSSGSAVDSLSITSSPTRIPGGFNGTFADGSDQASGWNGNAPTMESSTARVTAYAWTNSPNGGNVSGSVSGLPATGLTPAGIQVVSSPNGNRPPLAHPGGNLGGLATPVPFATNTLVSSRWTYSLNTTGLSSATAGTYNATVTYTALSL